MTSNKINPDPLRIPFSNHYYMFSSSGISITANEGFSKRALEKIKELERIIRLQEKIILHKKKERII